MILDFLNTISWCEEYLSIDDPENSLRIIEDQLNLRGHCSSLAFYNLDLATEIIGKVNALKENITQTEVINYQDFGRLLVYHPFQSTCDCSAPLESKSFFGDCDNPPIDMWFYAYDDLEEGLSILCWIPKEFEQYAQDVIDINAPPGITQWLEVENSVLNNQIIEELNLIDVKGKSYQKLADNISCQLTILNDTNGFSIKQIDKGVLFLFAVWSPTLVFFQLLIQELKKLNVNDVNIYILDIDGISESFYENELKTLSHAKGETFWINNGKVIGELLNYGEGYEDKVKTFTKRIIHG